MMEMTKILDCLMTDCAFNKDKKCHTIAITVGGGMCPLCDTAMKSSKKGSIPDISGSVGACKVDNCQFNTLLECSANGIHVKMHDGHAECGTFKAK